MQGTRIVKEPTDNGKYENMFIPEILEAAKKKCWAWFGVSNMSCWRIDQTSLGIMGWAFSEEQTTSAETEVNTTGIISSEHYSSGRNNESADWVSESELSDVDPRSAIDDFDKEEEHAECEETEPLAPSASDDESVDDPQYAEMTESWDIWNGPCVCGSKRPGRGCTSTRCIHDDVDEAPQKSSSEPCGLRPIGSSED